MKSAAIISGQNVTDVLIVESQLAERWACSVKKIQADRLKGRGPQFLKIGRLVRYRLSDVIDYENSSRHQSTSQMDVSSSNGGNSYE